MLRLATFVFLHLQRQSHATNSFSARFIGGRKGIGLIAVLWSGRLVIAERNSIDLFILILAINVLPHCQLKCLAENIINTFLVSTLQIDGVVHESVSVENVLHRHTSKLLWLLNLSHLLLGFSSVVLLASDVLQELFGTQDRDAPKHFLLLSHKLANLDLATSWLLRSRR